MQTKHNDGGPAFPTSGWQESSKTPIGMSLRAWFAGQALTGLLTNYDSHSNNLTTCAKLAVLAADATLAQLNEQ